MSFKTNILQSHTVRQLLGATAGMLVAGGLYVGFEQLSTLKMTALLVQPNATVSENAGEVSTNARELDDDTARRLAQRAQAVADQMKLYTAVVQPQVPATPMAQRTQDRLAERQQQLSAFSQTHTAAPVYPANSGAPVDQLTRLQQRVEYARQQREETEAANSAAIAAATAEPQPLDLAGLRKAVQGNPALVVEPADNAIIDEVVAAETTLHSGADLQKVAIPTAKRLTSSGAKENVMLLLTLAACIGIALSNPLRRTRLIALLAPRQ